jgi:branched-chain amino acid transport system ATP-binding protein
MLEVSDVHVSYGKVEAVRGVSLTVKPGKVTLVLGANGAGKSTTLKAVAGLEKPSSTTLGSPASRRTRSSAGASPWSRRAAGSSRR